MILYKRTSSTGGPLLQKTLCNSGAPPMPELELRLLHGERRVPVHVGRHALEQRLECGALHTHFELVGELPLVPIGDGDASRGNRRPLCDLRVVLAGVPCYIASSTFQFSGMTPEENLTMCSWRPRTQARRSTWRSCPPTTLEYIQFSKYARNQNDNENDSRFNGCKQPSTLYQVTGHSCTIFCLRWWTRGSVS